MIYFDSNKEAYAFEIPHPVCVIGDDVWKYHSLYPHGTTWDIIDDKFIELHSVQEIESNEQNKEHIQKLKKNLADTDYKVLKFADGALSEDEYAPIRKQRQMWRDEINRLESELI